MKKKLICIVLAANAQLLWAQVPHLKGEVNVSILEGSIACDLAYSNLPQLKNYSIWLNTGLNVRYFRNEDDHFNYADVKYYDSKKSSEAFQYYFQNKDQTGKLLPQKMQLNYMGKFPVVSDTLKADDFGDWKGNIAFNGKHIRASEQTNWYPALYNIDDDILMNEVTYDIKVNCIDCESIYLNGATPIKGKTGHFKSEKPVSMLLFAGLFDFSKNQKTYFLNAGLGSAQEQVLADWTKKIITFYEKKLKMPYGSPVSYLYTTPTSKKNAWMFVTYPSIAVIGHQNNSLKSYFAPNENRLQDHSKISFFAHELGHYYFGGVINPNSDLRWFFLEGLTEYLALQTSKEILGDAEYQAMLNDYLNATKNYSPKPLFTTKGYEIDEVYRYSYAPLLLTALEKEVGQDRVWNWLRTVLNSEKPIKTDYTFFKQTLIKSGIKESEFKHFEDKYILSENAKANVYDKIK